MWQEGRESQTQEIQHSVFLFQKNVSLVFQVFFSIHFLEKFKNLEKATFE